MKDLLKQGRALEKYGRKAGSFAVELLEEYDDIHGVAIIVMNDAGSALALTTVSGKISCNQACDLIEKQIKKYRHSLEDEDFDDSDEDKDELDKIAKGLKDPRARLSAALFAHGLLDEDGEPTDKMFTEVYRKAKNTMRTSNRAPKKVLVEALNKACGSPLDKDELKEFLHGFQLWEISDAD